MTRYAGRPWIVLFFLASLCPSPLRAAEKPTKKIVLIAGTLDPGHPRGTHEYEKSVRLLAHCLDTSPNLKGVRTEVHFNGWPRDDSTLDTADTIVLISNGSDRRLQDHPILVVDRLQVLGKQMKRGCGLVVIHWTTFVPRAGAGERFLDWVGGHFDYESGPPPRHWASAIQHLTTTASPAAKDHPICRGVEPFRVREEFYYRIRFRDKDPRPTPILRATIPGEKEEQTVAWALTRPDGGRGFGFTGGHYFDNWRLAPFRKLVLNAIAWTAGAEVPRGGVESTVPRELFGARALILTGHDGPFHDWKKTSKALKEVLEADPRIRADIHEGPDILEDEKLFDYDLLVQNYVNWKRPGLSKRARANFRKFVADGRGLAVIHFANGAFHFSLPGAKDSDWPEYRRLVRRVWDHTEGKSGHDPFGPFRVFITPVKHPITAGMKPFDTVDELYFRQQGDQPIEPLVTARSRITGKDEPLAWAYRYEKGRVFQTLLGHAEVSIRAPGPAELIRRGCLWAAGLEQPKPGARAEKDDRFALTLTKGRFGKGLDARRSPAQVDGAAAYRRPPLMAECWAKLAGKKGFNILVASDPKTSADHWEIYTYARSGKFSAYFPGLTPSEIVSDVDVCDGKWHHLAMGYDGKEVRLFVDGKEVLKRGVKKKPGLTPVPGPLTIGMTFTDLAGGRIGCEGVIDDVRLSRALRPITKTPDGPLPLDPLTTGLWHFDGLDKLAVDPAWTPTPLEGDVPAYFKETDADWVDDRLQKMNTGPFFDATFQYPSWKGKARAFKGTAIRIGDHRQAAVLFDRNRLRLAAGWTGDFLEHSSRRFGLLNTPKPAGPVHFATSTGPGWAGPDGGWKPDTPPTGPLPRAWGHYRGLYLHGPHTVLAYTVGKTPILESPWLETSGEVSAFTRTLEVGPASAPLRLLVCELPGESGRLAEQGGVPLVVGTEGDTAIAVALVGEKGAEMSVNGRRVEMAIAAGKADRRYKVLLWQGEAKDLPHFAGLVKKSPAPADLRAWTRPGPARWTERIVTRLEVAPDDGPYVVDTLTVPHENPYRALFFLTGIDFLPDGDLAVCTAHGDVWLVRGAQAGKKLTWKRFATGLYQPLGLKVVGGVIHVLERGQITRLHDTNGDDEADFYENFDDDAHVGGGEHSFHTCLEVDPEGRFYFFATGDPATPTGGCLLRVSKDGKTSEVFATGFRHPIGLGMSPTGIVTGADQQGNWMPATRIDEYHKGGFYGDMRTHHRKVPPKIYDPPLCWLPHLFDNSAGGQVWVPEGRFGPLAGQMLHLSYGRCRIMLVMRQEVDGLVQGGAVDLGLQFLAGVKTGGFHPRDGHLYLVGLDGWQTAATQDGCLQRVRYTGKEVRLPLGLSVHENGILLRYSQPLDRKSAEDVGSYRLAQWNYRWREEYGSKDWSVKDPGRVGHDPVAVQKADLLDDGRSVFLHVTGLAPVMQMEIAYDLKTAKGKPMKGVVYNTIHRLGKARW